MEHIALGQGGHRIGGDDIQQGVGDADRRPGGSGGFLRHLAQPPPHRKEVGRQQTQRDGQRGGAQVEQNGFSADAAHLFGVSQAAGAHGDGGEHQRHHHHFDEVEEQNAEGLDIGSGDVRRGLQGQPGQDAQEQADQNLHGKGRLMFHGYPS